MALTTDADQLERLFSSCDRNKSGFIEKNEFDEICVGMEFEPEEMSDVFQELDKDGDGRLGKDEFIAGFTEVFTDAQRVRKESTTSNDVVEGGGARKNIRASVGQLMTKSLALANLLNAADMDFYLLDPDRQEQVCDFYQQLHSSDEPALVQRFEDILLSVIKDIRQQQFENDRLEKSFKREKEQHSRHLLQLEEELEVQMQKVETRVRNEERSKLEYEKEDLKSQLETEINQLQTNLQKLQQIKVTSSPENDEVKTRLDEMLSENRHLKSSLTDAQTNLALVKSEMAGVRHEYQHKCGELESEKDALGEFLREQDSLTRQIYLMHDANKKLHDTNDDLMHALDNTRSTPVQKRSHPVLSYSRPRIIYVAGGPRPHSAGSVKHMPADYVTEYLSSPDGRPRSANSSLAEELGVIHNTAIEHTPHHPIRHHLLPAQESCEIDSLPDDFVIRQTKVYPVEQEAWTLETPIKQTRLETAIEADDTAIYADDPAIESDETAIEADDTAIEADDTAIAADNTAIEADDTAIKTDDTEINAYNTAIHAYDTAIQTDDTAIQADDTALEAEYTAIEANDTAIEADSTTIHADDTAIYADNTAIYADDTAIQADNTAKETDDASTETDDTSVETDETAIEANEANIQMLKAQGQVDHGQELVDMEKTEQPRVHWVENGLPRYIYLEDGTKMEVDSLENEEGLVSMEYRRTTVDSATGMEYGTEHNDSGHSTLREPHEFDSEFDPGLGDDSPFSPRKRNRVLHGPVSIDLESMVESELQGFDDLDGEMSEGYDGEADYGRPPSRAASIGSKSSGRTSVKAGRRRRHSPSPQKVITAEPERMYKVVLCGDAAVGKSSFILRLCKDKFVSNLNSTLGVDFHTKTLEVDGRIIALQLWDTAGQERFRSIAKSYFRRADGVLLLYDVTYERSFINVRDWVEAIEEGAENNVPIMIVGNKMDLRDDYEFERAKKCVKTTDGARLAREFGALFIEASAKDGENIMEAVTELSRLLRTNEDLEIKNVGMKLTEDKKSLTSCC